MKYVGIVIFVVLAMLACVALQSFAAMQLYTWFVRPIFTSMPTIPFLYFYGYLLLVALLRPSDTRTMVKEEYRPKLEFIPFVEPAAILFFGWILHLIIG